jgi:RHS repeat-associated protein
LDRLVDCTPTVQATTRRFYQKDRLTTEIQGTLQRSIMQHDDQVLAQQCGGLTQLLATDEQRSVLNVLDAARLNPLAYSPYGHRPEENGLLSLLGFNGERPDPVTGWYLLGNGYRVFNPVLMRFNSPESWSPFGEGGLNAYGYCLGDPVNERDDTGHMPRRSILRKNTNAASRSEDQRLLGTSSQSLSTSRDSLSAPIASTNRTTSPDADITDRIKSDFDILKNPDKASQYRERITNVGLKISAAYDQPANYYAWKQKNNLQEQGLWFKHKNDKISPRPLTAKQKKSLNKEINSLTKQKEKLNKKLEKILSESAKQQGASIRDN